MLSRLAPDLLIPHLGHLQGPVILELRVSTCSKYRAKGEPDHDVVKLILGPISGFSVGYLIINASTHYDNPFSFICLSVSGSIGSHLFSSPPPFAPGAGDPTQGFLHTRGTSMAEHHQHSSASLPQGLALPLSDDPDPASFLLISSLITELRTILGRPVDSGKCSVGGHDLKEKTVMFSVSHLFPRLSSGPLVEYGSALDWWGSTESRCHM